MKRFLAFFLFLIYGFTASAQNTGEPTELYAQSAVLMDAESGRVLFSKNGEQKMPMASTTKIMTCILALEMGNLTDVVQFSNNAASQPKVHLGAKAGEEFYLNDLLYSLMLESHNDVAVAIAEHIGGSVEEFATYMNDKARSLGCDATYYITPNGLDAEDEKGIHSTTATELARVMSYCILESPQKEMFLKITGTPSHQFSNIEGTRSYQCSNKNSFLSMMDGAFSGKTGYTAKAGYCYVGALERDDRTFVVALLACGWPNNKNYKWKDTLKLMEYAVEYYQYTDTYPLIELPEILVKGGIPKNDRLFLDAYAKLRVGKEEEQDFRILLHQEETTELRLELAETLEAPVQEGEKVGEVICYLGEEELCRYPIVLDETIEKKNMSWCFSKLLRQYLHFE